MTNITNMTNNTEYSENTIYGYCRCSTNEELQDITRQIDELKKLGVKDINIKYEYRSGAKEDREVLNALLDTVVSGDTIVATEVSRISRSTAHFCKIIELVKEKHIQLILGSLNVDCRDDGELDALTEGMLKMFAVFSEIERNITSERVKSGMKHAQEQGKEIGRPSTTIDNIPDKFKQYYPLYESGKINVTDLKKLTGIKSRTTVYKYIKIMKDNQE